MADARELNFLHERMAALERKIDANDKSLRDEINRAFSKLGSELGGRMQVMVGRVEDHSERLIVLEEQRRVSKERREEIEKERNRRASLLGAITGAGAAAIMKIVLAAFGK